MTDQWLSGVGSTGKDGLQGPEGTFGDTDARCFDYSDGFPDVYIRQNSSNRYFQYVRLIYAKLYIIKSVKKCFLVLALYF